MNRLTVLQYITPSRLGGAEEHFLNLVRDQKERGHRVIAVTKRDTPLRALIEKTGVDVRPWHTHGKFDLPTLLKLCRLIRREKVDVIHTHLTTASWLGALAGKLTRTPVVSHVHAADSRTWFQWADYHRAVANGVKAHLVAQGLRAEKIEVVYYGIDMKKYSGGPGRESARAAFGIAGDVSVVGLAASLQERKGHRYLLQALKDIEAGSGAVHALFAGEGPEEGALRALAAELGLAERVHFVGFRSDIREVLAACDVFALPSRKEGLSIAVMEAMAVRVPVVATDIAGMGEVVRPEETGLLVEPFQSAPLAAAIAKLLSDKEFAARMAANAYAFLDSHFRQSVCLDHLDGWQADIVAAWHRHERVQCAARATI